MILWIVGLIVNFNLLAVRTGLLAWAHCRGVSELALNPLTPNLGGYQRRTEGHPQTPGGTCPLYPLLVIPAELVLVKTGRRNPVVGQAEEDETCRGCLKARHQPP